MTARTDTFLVIEIFVFAVNSVQAEQLPRPDKSYILIDLNTSHCLDPAGALF